MTNKPEKPESKTEAKSSSSTGSDNAKFRVEISLNSLKMYEVAFLVERSGLSMEELGKALGQNDIPVRLQMAMVWVARHRAGEIKSLEDGDAGELSANEFAELVGRFEFVGAEASANRAARRASTRKRGGSRPEA